MDGEKIDFSLSFLRVALLSLLMLLADTRNPNASTSSRGLRERKMQRERERERERGGERQIRKEVKPAKILRLVITAYLLRYETLRRILNCKRIHARA